jgi:hypothetical protein
MPCDYEILTRRGWLKYEKVRVGDETIGYNFETGRSEWTRITAAHHYPVAPMVRYGNKYWSAECTLDHRWLTERVVRHYDGQQTGLTCPECGATSSRRGPGGLYGAPFRSPRALQIHRARTHAIPGTTRGGRTTTREVSAGFALRKLSEMSPQDRIVLAREADTSSSLDITTQEASLLGWIAGDGWVTEAREYWYPREIPPPGCLERTTEAPFGRRKDGQPKKGNSGRPFATGPRRRQSSLNIGISQSKEQYFAAIDQACAADPQHTRYEARPGRKTHWKPSVQWRLSAAYSRDLLKRAGNPKADAVPQVLRMSTEQRDAWLEAMLLAEGCQTSGKIVYYQNAGELADAIELTVYLSGCRPSRGERFRQERIAVQITETSSYVGGPSRRAYLSKAAPREVWCPTTELGSWTARSEEGGIFLTG